MKNSAIDNPESTIITPVFFPFTFISPSIVEAMSLCFNRVAVYHPAHSKPENALGPWIDMGFLDVRSPLEKVIDKKTLEAALPNFRCWGLLHQHSDTAYLKSVGNDIAPVTPETPSIASDIRATASKTKTSKGSEESQLSLQLFLHLAQEFDQQAWELRQQLKRFDHQYQALQTSFRQDETEQGHVPIPKEVFPVMGQDPGDYMIEKRIAAWNRLFQKGPAGSNVLFTNSQSALTCLLDKAEDGIEVLNLNFTYSQAESTKLSKNHPSWVDHIQEIFNKVLTTPWSRTLQKRIAQMGSEIDTMIDSWSESTMKSHDRTASFRWFVVPDQGAPGLLNRCCGVDTGNEDDETVEFKNTLVGIIEESRSAHHSNA